MEKSSKNLEVAGVIRKENFPLNYCYMDSRVFFHFFSLTLLITECHIQVLSAMICNMSVLPSSAWDVIAQVPCVQCFLIGKKITEKNALFGKSIHYLSLCSAFHFIRKRHIPKDQFVSHSSSRNYFLLFMC